MDNNRNSVNASALHNYSEMIYKCMNDIIQKRQDNNLALEKDYEKQNYLQHNIEDLTQRLAIVSKRISKRLTMRSNFESSLHDIEICYKRIISMSEDLSTTAELAATTLCQNDQISIENLSDLQTPPPNVENNAQKLEESDQCYNSQKSIPCEVTTPTTTVAESSEMNKKNTLTIDDEVVKSAHLNAILSPTVGTSRERMSEVTELAEDESNQADDEVVEEEEEFEIDDDSYIIQG